MIPVGCTQKNVNKGFIMKFWEAMREMQENGKKVRCKRWNGKSEIGIYWQMGDDCDLPTGFDWEDALDEWELYEER